MVGREALQGSLQRAAILTTDKFKGVRLQLAQNQMKISPGRGLQRGLPARRAGQREGRHPPVVGHARCERVGAHHLA
ncbi:hypothetical protein G6F55_014315 [Rhizopus delemar]|nr:hypothetical protein G6F55_014315 [Rhizopus delemar]